MSFLPDLASWALRGGAGDGDDDGDNENSNAAGAGGNNLGGGGEAGGAQGEAQLTEDEVRAKRLARMMAMQNNQGSKSEGEGGGDESDKMDVDSSPPAAAAAGTADAAMDSKPAAAVASSAAAAPDADQMDVDEPQKKKRSIAASTPTAAAAAATGASTTKSKPKPSNSKSNPTPADLARKLQRKKELLLRRTLAVTLAPSPTDPSCVSIDIDDSADSSSHDDDGGNGTSSSPNITVQSVAEILAARLSLPPNSAALRTSPPQRPGTVAYLGWCYVRAGEESKTLRQSRDRRDKKGDKSGGGGSNNDALDRQDDELRLLLAEIQSQVVSYAASSLMEPDLFELGTDGSKQLADALKSSTLDPANSVTMTIGGASGTSFYAKLCEELTTTDVDEFGRVLGEVVTVLSDDLVKCETVMDGGGSGSDGGLGGGPLVIVNAMTALCGHKGAAGVVSRHPTFLLPAEGTAESLERVQPAQPALPPNATPQQVQFFRMMSAMTQSRRPGYAKRSGPALEKSTLLGRVMRIGCPAENSAVAGTFGNVVGRSQKDVKSSVDGLRRQLGVYQGGVMALVKGLVTAGAEPRGQVMQWFKDAFLVNTGATALRPDKSKVSDPSTLINIYVTLLKLCEPFVTNDKKAALIDPGFVSSPADHSGVYTTEGDDAVTLLAEDPPPRSAPYQPKNSFIPQCFFFAARALHLSFVPSSNYFNSVTRQMRHTLYHIQQRNEDPRADPNLNHIMSVMYATDVTVLAPDMLGDTLRFVNAMGGLLLRVDDDDLARMPEHFVDDMCDVLTFVTSYAPDAMRGIDLGNVFRVVVKLLSPKHAGAVRNYNLRAKLGDVLHDVYLPSKANDRGNAVPASVSCDPLVGGQPYLLSDPSAQETLAPSLLLLYGEVEHTGYYDKMSYRRHIAELLRYLWESSEHRPAFRKIAQNKESFMKFANGIMNETNSLIASVMEKLPEIRRVQVQMANPQEWAAIPEEQRETITSRHEENEEEVKRALPLCNRTLEMLCWLNTDADIRNLFLLDEMIGRLVNMLFHVLMKLVGSKGLELKVDNPESYNFRPKDMLRDLCAIFANFASAPEFILECAQSGYYNADLVNKSAKTCRKLNLLTEESMEAFASLTEKVAAASKTVEDFDELTKDAPDEFLDPIMCAFMKDPVFLPTSDKFMDRTTITQHLLNDPTDPFNRKPLTVDMVKPATELKEKMNKWLDEKRAAAAAAAGQSASD